MNESKWLVLPKMALLVHVSSVNKNDKSIPYVGMAQESNGCRM